MTVQINAQPLVGNSISIQIDKWPRRCPKCHHDMIPLVRTVEYFSRHGTQYVQAALRCTNELCSQLFIAIFESSQHALRTDLKRLEPMYPADPEVHELIAEISPAYVEIFKQALAAESHSLHQLVGIGLRKALEFLVKDYACVCHPTEVEKIKGMRLAKCIQDFVADPNVKKCAMGATWLGNDETHYVRFWEDKDVNDLKRLLRLTNLAIASDLEMRKYEEEMGLGTSKNGPLA